MKAEFITPFVDAAASVADVMMGQKPERGAIGVKAEFFAALPINILCGFNGDLEGIVMYSMSKDTALNIAGLMLGDRPNVFNQLVASALSELGNMITGNSSSNFSGQGIVCNITPPTLVRGQTVKISTNNQPTIVIPLVFKDLGTIEVNVSLRETKLSLAA
jgi:chemotaxis protein CheX